MQLIAVSSTTFNYFGFEYEIEFMLVSSYNGKLFYFISLYSQQLLKMRKKLFSDAYCTLLTASLSLPPPHASICICKRLNEMLSEVFSFVVDCFTHSIGNGVLFVATATVL